MAFSFSSGPHVLVDTYSENWVIWIQNSSVIQYQQKKRQILDLDAHSSKNICPILEKNIIHRIFFNIKYDNIIDGQQTNH